MDVLARPRVVTEFLTSEGSIPIQINGLPRSVFDQDALNVSSVTFWVCRFKSGGKGNW
jgi:hypothetical protein